MRCILRRQHRSCIASFVREAATPFGNIYFPTWGTRFRVMFETMLCGMFFYIGLGLAHSSFQLMNKLALQNELLIRYFVARLLYDFQGLVFVSCWIPISRTSKGTKIGSKNRIDGELEGKLTVFDWGKKTIFDSSYSGGGGGSKKWGFEKSGLHCNYILIFFSRVVWNMSVKTSLVLHQIRYKIGLKKLTRATFSSSRSDSEVKPNPFVTHSHSFWNVLHQQQVVACSFNWSHCIISVLLKWLRRFLSFWLYDSQLKSHYQAIIWYSYFSMATKLPWNDDGCRESIQFMPYKLKRCVAVLKCFILLRYVLVSDFTITFNLLSE